MSKRHDKDFLEDITVCLARIIDYTAGITYDEFLADLKTQDAIIRNIEVIGEASKQLSSELKNSCPNIPWKMIAGTRDRLIHGYFGVNIDVIWEIASIDVPVLVEEINKIRGK
jgi:uncharacterized protein with HEPN domain